MSVRGEQNNFLGFNGNQKRSITHLISEGSQPRGPAQGSVPTQGTSRSFLGRRPEPKGRVLDHSVLLQGTSSKWLPQGTPFTPRPNLTCSQ